MIACLVALLSQVKNIIIVDNNSVCDVGEIISYFGRKHSRRIKLIKLAQNNGLGTAYNMGIATARNLKAGFVLLLDQDSIPGADMVRKLYLAYQDLEKQGLSIGAVAPRYHNPASSRLSQFVRIAPLGLTRINCESQPLNYVRTDFLISSGSLIALGVLEQVGGMDDRLFIDHIDTEWCCRAQAKGFAMYGVCDAIMQHCLGDNQIHIWWGFWRNVPVHQSFRYYYMIRNSVLLWQRPYMPAAWKRADMLRSANLFFFFTVFSSKRLANLRMMLKGLSDGINQRVGKL